MHRKTSENTKKRKPKRTKMQKAQAQHNKTKAKTHQNAKTHTPKCFIAVQQTIIAQSLYKILYKTCRNVVKKSDSESLMNIRRL